jgi:hypothetical protein
VKHTNSVGRYARAGLCVVLVLGVVPIADGYSVLTHEAIIDATWKDNIVPLLLKRFPNASPDELLKAHAYAYGGAIIQDMGYYPFGSKFFSDLTHYVRSGDFVLNLLDEATDLNEYAFALGAVSHYVADNDGHPVATNRVVPIMFPKLQQKFGRTITYGDNPAAHLKVEFSFDVIQVAQGNYAPEAYHDFVGFEVAQASLERAFLKTYSIDMSNLFVSEDLAIGTYRYTISSILPTMTKAAWSLKKDEIQKAQPSATRKKFIYSLSRSSYRKKWGKDYKQPGFGARLIAFMFRVFPKVGPFKALAFQATPPAAETMFMRSFNETLERYRALLVASDHGVLLLPNQNFDTGEPTKPGVYRLADDTYAKLLGKLDGKPVSSELRADILNFYSNPNAPLATKRDDKAWKKVMNELDTLRAAEEVDHSVAGGNGAKP